MLTYPFQILQKRLKAEVTVIKEIDWYLGQDSETDNNTWIYSSPVLFIEFLPYEVKDLGKRMQQAEVEFNLHLLTSNVQDSGKRMQMVNASDHMMIFDAVYKSITGFGALISYLDEFSSLASTDGDQRIMTSCSRAGIIPPHRIRKAMMRSTQRFKTVLYDQAAVRPTTPVDAPPEITGQIIEVSL